MGVARPDGDCPGASDDDDDDPAVAHPLTSSATPSTAVPSVPALSAAVLSAAGPAYARTRGVPAPMKLLTFRPAGFPLARRGSGQPETNRIVVI